METWVELKKVVKFEANSVLRDDIRKQSISFCRFDTILSNELYYFQKYSKRQSTSRLQTKQF